MPVTVKKQGEKLEAVNIRLTPKMKFALELAARREEKSQAAYVVECVLEKLKGETSGLFTTPTDSSTARYLPDLVWHTLEYRRITNLGIYEPLLLDRREQLIWTVIEENPAYWDQGKPVFSEIRKNWSQIQSDAERLGSGDL